MKFKIGKDKLQNTKVDTLQEVQDDAVGGKYFFDQTVGYKAYILHTLTLYQVPLSHYCNNIHVQFFIYTKINSLICFT